MGGQSGYGRKNRDIVDEGKRYIHIFIFINLKQDDKERERSGKGKEEEERKGLNFDPLAKISAAAHVRFEWVDNH